MLNRDQIAHEYILSGVATTVHSAFQLADAMLAEAEKRKSTERPSVVGDGWVSVEDRLPEKDTDVLTCDTHEEMWIDVHPFSRRTTHWQPLPQAPKGASK